MSARSGIHAAPVVSHHEKRAGERGWAAFPKTCFREHLDFAIAGFNRDLATAGHRVPRIENQVEQNLLRLGGVHLDQTQIGIEVELQIDVFPDQANQQVAHALCDLVEGKQAGLGIRWPGSRPAMSKSQYNSTPVRRLLKS